MEKKLAVADADPVILGEHVLIALLAVHLKGAAVASDPVGAPVEEDVDRAVRYAGILEGNVVVSAAANAGERFDQQRVANLAIGHANDQAGHEIPSKAEPKAGSWCVACGVQ